MKKIFIGLTVILCVSATNSFSQTLAAKASTPAFKAKTAAAPSTSTAAVASISFKEKDNVHDFGTVPQGTPVTYVFSFENTGKAPLVLSSVTASCGCTTPEWPKEAVAPGKAATIKVTYNAANVGPFTKPVTIVSNAANPTTVITIKGEVKSPAPAQ